MKKLIITILLATAIVWRANPALAVCVAGDTVAPAKVTNLNVVGVGGTGIIYSFTSPADTSGLAEVDLRYRTIPITALNFASSTQTNGEPTPASPGTLQTVSLSGLPSNTLLYIALKVKDGCGKWSAISNVKSFTTVAPERVISVEWSYNPPSDPPPDSPPGEEVVGYKLYFGEYFASFMDPDTFQGEIIIEPGSYIFTLTAMHADGTESPPSPPYPFTVSE